MGSTEIYKIYIMPSRKRKSSNSSYNFDLKVSIDTIEEQMF